MRKWESELKWLKCVKVPEWFSRKITTEGTERRGELESEKRRERDGEEKWGLERETWNPLFPCFFCASAVKFFVVSNDRRR